MDDRNEEERLADQERKANDEVFRATRAKQILEDELFKAAVDAVRAKLHDGFAKSRIDDDGLRKQARIGLSLLDTILNDLDYHIQTGKLAKASLEEVEQRKGFLDRFRRSAA